LGPRELFSKGELTACVRAAESAPELSERILQVYALARLGNYNDGLDALAKIEAVDSDDRALVSALAAQCYLLQGEVEKGRCVLAELREAPSNIEALFEIAYARMLLAWNEGHATGMEIALESVDVTWQPHLYGRWLAGRSWAAALRGDYPAQLQLLKETVKHLQTPAGTDVSLLAASTRSLVHLVREIAAPGAFEFTVSAVQQIPWTADLEHERFLTFRGLAWAYALRGMHETALHYAYFARDIAPSVMWIMACYADQAYLARMAGEDWSADALLKHAIACAQEIEWSSPGEERIALLNLIELAADRDLEAANRLLDIYQLIPVALSPRLALSHDERLQAMEKYAGGTVLAAAGDRTAAIAELQSSYSSFKSIGYAWRAAAVALRLDAITGDHVWLRHAAEAVEGFPDSSVATEIRTKAVGVADPRCARLTPAQRRVFDLICQGLGDKEIAGALRISPDTVKNHAARVRTAFGVRSRAALIAASRRQAG
jgi:DNA-binding CsgD family transcriptional regulator